ncbi:MAG: precorrin-6y C5,15-methyltransferase (decarboxylating) subunit CbiE [Jaaginema sp. PMC 1079.18]|nr:precorrin-6y C5,15-methyltransferase (decarboxylating) subunit CbiE [Jaaginema sp. PMC 1080.18]MEC4852236.1 precorrin-6y C5,15-methyltransferase (decarboxylating) subunit CbiE [Jaaginema sp. PMC 1079.18]MEC4867742.1 precorrin-6y C5,15-methyltransferase (decarboxylating) subunit CbiE [Jaaginema sp. PMC 1078.18]
MAVIQVVGIGLEGEADLTPRVQKIVKEADILVGSDRHLNYFPGYPAQRLTWGDFTTTIATLKQYQIQGQKIVVLASGDPLFFGIGRLLLSAFAPEELHFLPHISAVQIALNRLKIPWQDTEIISLHGRSSETLIKALQQGRDKIAILTDNIHTPGAIAQLYLALKLPVTYQFWVCENLGGANEKLTSYNATELQYQTCDPLNIVVLIRQENDLILSDLPIFGLDDSLFRGFRDRPGLMTKRDIRLAILGEIALKPQQIIWDIGAGTGSVAIEMARLVPTATVYAIEKTAMGYDLVVQNAARFGVENVVPIRGIAPPVLNQLPAPHRVFIGGSNNKIEAILELCYQQLNPQDGRVVLAFATVENLNTALTWLRSRSYAYHLLQLNIARSVPVASLTRLTPLNPVTLVVTHNS